MIRRILYVVVLFAACGVPPRQKAVDVLQKGSVDESIVIRVAAAKGYAQTGDLQGMKILYDILRGEDKNGIAAALAALYDLKEDTYSPVVVKLTEHDDPLVRSEAFRLIAGMHDERCKEILIAGTQSNIAKIRRFAYMGLEKFRATDVLIKGLHDRDPLVRITAAKALGLLGKEDMANVIRKEMKTVNIEIWSEAVLALGALHDTTAISFIRDSLMNAQEVPVELRLTAAEALLMFDNTEGIPLLKETLDTGNPFMRVKVVRILKEHKTKAGTELLRKAASDEYINVSVVAVEALGEFSPKEHRDLFAALLNAPNPLLRTTAAAAYLRGE